MEKTLFVIVMWNFYLTMKCILTWLIVFAVVDPAKSFILGLLLTRGTTLVQGAKYMFLPKIREEFFLKQSVLQGLMMI